jgi:hypothetical protein
MKGSEAKGRAYASEMLVQGGKDFIKLPSSDRESEDGGPHQDRNRGGADSLAAGHLTCNQTPAYIRGSGPLD